ncbi:LPS export ABC transporter periplasmic protein LptC [Pseudomonas benzenivorans]|uniref:Lipopolysaccharide export system protein LptC n=1 Tax=Pseudomonas benzenivorans TaxID=556533 RepID=A0ABZ0PV36_9PSED|nr:LPS export ABC transporter periplasmic protein LptC [Pseudomonas benzenivorans]WPC04329.1 LPS export ABC transporter periplasmic protein LptC [Pseudomonas benzenivorans]
MLRKLLNLTLFAVAAALLAAVGYWNISPESFSDRPARAGTDNTIDFYVIGANTLQYQADGKLHYEMTTSKLEHIKATDITLLSEPNLHLYRGTQYPWKVRSVRGEVAPEGKEVELIDQVRVERTDAKGRPTILTTSRLTVFPEKEYAQTQQAVRIDAANGVTTAQGMKAYLNDGRMLLQSNVRGQHEVR